MKDFAGIDIGHYHIIEKLGDGGMAVVYRALDMKLEREVAIKFIRAEAIAINSAQMLRRFEREAKSLAKMDHPNIVQVIEYGEYESLPYLVMSYVSNGTFKQYIGEPVDYQRAIELVLPVGRALAYAHKQGVVHRDVKPANILIKEDGEVMLSDFGVAKIFEGDEESTQITTTGVGIGTPAYMSPEQAEGKHVDARSDIYALGVILYELVAGRRPFKADTPMAVILKQINDPLPRPIEFDVVVPDVIEKILFKALAKDPENRFQSMFEFVAALEKAKNGEKNLGFDVEVEPAKEGWFERFKSQQGMFALAATALLLVILLIALGTGLFSNGESKSATATANALAVLLPTETPTETMVPTVTETGMPSQTPTITLTPTITMTPTPDFGSVKVLYRNDFDDKADLYDFDLLKHSADSNPQADASMLQDGIFLIDSITLNGANLRTYFGSSNIIHVRYRIQGDQTCHAITVGIPNRTGERSEFRNFSMSCCAYGSPGLTAAINYEKTGESSEAYVETYGFLKQVPGEWVDMVIWFEGNDKLNYFVSSPERPNEYRYGVVKIPQDWQVKSWLFSFDLYANDEQGVALETDFLEIASGSALRLLADNAEAFLLDYEQINGYMQEPLEDFVLQPVNNE